jgi:hypothetical protein
MPGTGIHGVVRVGGFPSPPRAQSGPELARPLLRPARGQGSLRRHRRSALSRLRGIRTEAARGGPHCSSVFSKDMLTEAAESPAPALPVSGRRYPPAIATGRTSSMLHRHRPAWIPGLRTRRAVACLRCAGRSGRRVRSGHRRPRGRHRHAFWSRAACPRRGLRHGPIRRGFRASLRDRSHHDPAMRLGSMPMWTREQARQPREELFACESPFGVVRTRAQAFRSHPGALGWKPLW